MLSKRSQNTIYKRMRFICISLMVSTIGTTVLVGALILSVAAPSKIPILLVLFLVVDVALVVHWITRLENGLRLILSEDYKATVDYLFKGEGENNG
jgi:uncharacterized membrane protein